MIPVLLVTFRLRLHEFRAVRFHLVQFQTGLSLVRPFGTRQETDLERICQVPYKRKAYRYQFRTCSKWIRSGVNVYLDIVMHDVKTARL